MNQPQESFQTRLEKGQQGERSAITLLKKITEVRDMTEYDVFKHYQQKGFDIEYLNKDTGAWDRADIKSNITEAGLGFLELTASNGQLGWLYTTKADCILLHSRYTDKLYGFDVSTMRNYIKTRVEDHQSLKIHSVRNGAKGVWLPVDKNPCINEVVVPE